MKTTIDRMIFLNVIIFSFGNYVGRSVRVNIAIESERMLEAQQTADVVAHKVRQLFNDKALEIAGHELNGSFSTVPVKTHGIAGLVGPIRELVEEETSKNGGSFAALKITHASETVSI